MDKKEYLELSTHEMKNYVSAICGYSEFVSKGLVDKEVSENMNSKIYLLSKQLAEFLDKRHLYEVLKNGYYSEQPEWVSLQKVINNIMKEGDFSEKESDIRIGFTESVMLYGDDYLIGQMVYHLLENALRYGKIEKGIWIRAVQQGDMVKLVVENAAEPIAEEHIAHLTDPFYRVDKRKSRKLGGQGIGLSIISEIISLSNGVLRLYCENGIFRAEVLCRGNIGGMREPSCIEKL